MANYLELRWILFVAAVLAVCFLSWVFLNFSRDRNKKRQRDDDIVSRRRGRSGMWE